MRSMFNRLSDPRRPAPPVPGWSTLYPLLSSPLRRWRDFYQLARVDRPIGVYLLLWPTLTALWIAAGGLPSLKNLLIFVLGTLLMRAAGCAINDFADRNLDGHVQRTRDRPLAAGRISPKEALLFAALLAALAFMLVLLTNAATIGLSFVAVAVAAFYPFTKRFTQLPQAVLGAAYSFGIPMAFTAQTGSLPAAAWLLFAANFLWTIAYDTYYAMADREDDLKIGVRSSAILFGAADRPIILALQGGSLVCLALAGWQFRLGTGFYLGLLAAAGCFAWEFWTTRGRQAQDCFRAFLHNHWAGLAVLLGCIAQYLR